MNQEKYVCNQSTTMKNSDGATQPSYHLKLKYPLPLSVSYVQLITHRTNQELFEKPLCIQGSHYEKYERFTLCKESHHVQTQN